MLNAARSMEVLFRGRAFQQANNLSRAPAPPENRYGGAGRILARREERQ
jgi:hypothetical protein